MPKDETPIGSLWGWTWTHDLKTQKTWFTNPQETVAYSLEGLATDAIARSFIFGCVIATPTARSGLISELHAKITGADLDPEVKRAVRNLIPAY